MQRRLSIVSMKPSLIRYGVVANSRTIPVIRNQIYFSQTEHSFHAISDQIIPLSPRGKNAAIKDRLCTIIDLLAHQTERYQQHMLTTDSKDSKNDKKIKKKEVQAYIEEHHVFLNEVVNQLRDICANADGRPDGNALPLASTPYRQNKRAELQERRISIGSPLARSSKYFNLN